MEGGWLDVKMEGGWLDRRETLRRMARKKEERRELDGGD